MSGCVWDGSQCSVRYRDFKEKTRHVPVRGRDPGKRAQDCSSAPLARARSGSKAQGHYAVNAPCLSVLSYASSSNWSPGPSIQMVGVLYRTVIHGPEIWLYIF